MRTLYQFNIDCGRMGDLEGIFTEDDKIVEALIGEVAYFHEVLGKHSEIRVVFKESDFKVLTTDQDFINQAYQFGLISSGINPFDYVGDETSDKIDKVMKQYGIE